jgi:hypothetical protein
VFQDTAPASFPVDVFPAGAKVVVAAVGATRAGVVAAAPSFASTNFTRHIRRLTEAGWIDQRGALGGFSNPRAVNTRLCRGQQAIDIALYPREAGGSYLRVTTQPPEPCRTDRPSPFRDTAMPLLLPPPGVWSPGSGGGGGNDTRHFGSQLISREKLAPVTAHFVDQMTKSDWPIAGRVTDDLMSVSLHRSKTTSGDAITSVVSLTAVPEAGMIDAWLRIIRHN